VREEESGIQVLAFKGFQVISPLEKDLPGVDRSSCHLLNCVFAAGVWRKDPQTVLIDDEPGDPDLLGAISAHIQQLRGGTDEQGAAGGEQTAAAEGEGMSVY